MHTPGKRCVRQAGRAHCSITRPQRLQMTSRVPSLLVHGVGHEEEDLSARYLSMPLPLGGSVSGRRRALSADMATAQAAASRRGSWPVPPGLPSGAQLPAALLCKLCGPGCANAYPWRRACLQWPHTSARKRVVNGV